MTVAYGGLAHHLARSTVRGFGWHEGSHLAGAAGPVGLVLVVVVVLFFGARSLLSLARGRRSR